MRGSEKAFVEAVVSAVAYPASIVQPIDPVDQERYPTPVQANL